MTDKEILDAEKKYRHKQRKVICSVLRASLKDITNMEHKALVQQWIAENSNDIVISGEQLVSVISKASYHKRIR